MANLSRQLPLFKDPYYNYDSHILDTSSRNPLRPISSAPLIGRNSGMCNPFVDGIDYDYGYGKEQIRREYAQRRGEILPGSSIRPHSLMLSGSYSWSIDWIRSN
ncbi:hypothetical protein KEM48_004782 [Puccinia striiformis f. sp. tritici PST-130]|nr:hypothetical protein KEM48_004782 [Puccinia striiformis f. sp. tritici PST-130]